MAKPTSVRGFYGSMYECEERQFLLGWQFLLTGEFPWHSLKGQLVMLKIEASESGGTGMSFPAFVSAEC